MMITYKINALRAQILAIFALSRICAFLVKRDITYLMEDNA